MQRKAELEEKKVEELVSSALQSTSYGETVIDLVVEAIISKKWDAALPKIASEIRELLEDYEVDLLCEPVPVSLDEAKAMFSK